MSINTKQHIKYKPQKIEFRLWTGKKMMYPHNLQADDYAIDLYEETYELDDYGRFSKAYLAKKAVPLLYTELKDINNKRIYDGDILQLEKPSRLAGWNKDYEGRRLLVTVNSGAFNVCLIDFKDNRWNRLLYLVNNVSKIIGNIFENPELLQMEKLNEH